MRRIAKVVTWNGKDVPPELKELPAGRYIVEAVEEEAPALHEEGPQEVQEEAPQVPGARQEAAVAHGRRGDDTRHYSR